MADIPSCALYAGLKSLGRINNGNAAQILMAGNARYGGRLISERLTVPSFISREIVHAKPGDLPEPLFAPFEQSARQILNLIMQNRGSDPQSLSKVAKRYMESCVPNMQDALTNCGVDGMLFRNGVERIETTDDSDIKDHLYIHLIFFIVTGCLATPPAPSSTPSPLCPTRCSRRLARSRRPSPHFSRQPRAPTGDIRLGLLRVVGQLGATAAASPYHEPGGQHYRVADWRRERHHRRRFRCLAPAPAHLVPRRSLACAGPRLHQRIVFDLGRRPLPAAYRAASTRPPRQLANTPVEIHNGDTLCLGATTRFLVIRITD